MDADLGAAAGLRLAALGVLLLGRAGRIGDPAVLGFERAAGDAYRRLA